MLTPESVRGLDTPGLTEAAHRSLSGSFTHTILEWTAVCAAAFVAILALAQYRLTRDASLPIIGIALACAGGMDAFHTLTADRLIEAVADNRNLIPFTWAICRLFSGLIQFVGVIVFGVWLENRIRMSLRWLIATSAGFVLCAHSIVYYCASSESLPQTMFPDAWITRPYDVIPLIPFLLCAFVAFPLYLKRHRTLFAYTLLLSLIPQIATQLYTAIGSDALHDTAFNVAHGLKALAYMVPVVGLVGEQLHAVRAHQRAERQLHASETRIRTVFNNMPDCLVTIDGRGVIETVNPACEIVFGYTAAELVGKNVSILMSHPYRSEHDAHLERYRRTGEPHVIGKRREATGMRKDGTVFPVDLSISAMDIDGKLKFNGIIRDITKQMEAQQTIARTAAMLAERMKDLKRSNAELEQFASVASHDLQEPLRKIQAFGDRLATRCGEAVDNQGRDYIHRMRNAAARMQELINDLLMFSRVARQASVEATPVDVERVVSDVLADLDEQVRATGAVVEIGKLPTINANETQLRQVFQNLLGNALKYRKADKKPVIKVFSRLESRQVPRSGTTERFWEISVQDNGIGFDPQYAEKVFEIFQRLHGRDEYEGTGIGLAICRKIAEQHGGGIVARSAPNLGTTFALTLPVESRNQEVLDGDVDEGGSDPLRRGRPGGSDADQGGVQGESPGQRTEVR